MINCTVADGKVVVSLPDAISGITIYAAGYKTDHRMEGCVSKAVTDTLMELPVSGERIKLFFLDTRTLNPVMPCLIAR